MNQEWETEEIREGDFHFSINHPKSWKVIAVSPLVWIRRPCRDVCPTFYLSNGLRKKGLDDPKQHPDFKVILDPKNNYTVLEEKLTTIDGRPTFTIQTEHPSLSGANSPVRQRFYYVTTDAFVYKLEYLEYDGKNDVYLCDEEWVFGDAFGQMVESLRFYN